MNAADASKMRHYDDNWTSHLARLCAWRGGAWQAEQGIKDQVKDALEHGASPSAALKWVCMNSSVGMFDVLVTYGLCADHVRQARGCEMLREACFSSRTAIALRLLDLGLTADDLAPRKCMALFGACSIGNIEIVEALLRVVTLEVLRDADEADNAPLVAACEYGQIEVVRRLVEFGLTVEDMRAHRGAAMIRACRGGHAAVVDYLLGHGVAIPGDRTVARCNSPHILTRLLALGARPSPEALESLARAEDLDPAAVARVLDVWGGSAELAESEDLITVRTARRWGAVKAAALGLVAPPDVDMG